jgi:hypothetical protein
MLAILQPAILLLRLGELARPLVKLLLEVGCGETATMRRRRLLAALELRRFVVARVHGCATPGRPDLASDHAITAIDVASGQLLMKPSQDVQDHARSTEIYHVGTDVERGQDRGPEGKSAMHHSSAA